jgi:hypothetical protein
MAKPTPVKKVIEKKRAALKKPAKMGRPTKYSKALADRICSELAMGKSMRTIERDPKMPAMVTMFRWLRTMPDFRQQYESAKEEAADMLVEEMLDIADDDSGDEIEKTDAKGNTYTTYNAEYVQRSRLRVDTRKWIASKLKPKRYAERLDIDHTTKGDKLPAAQVYLPQDMSADVVTQQAETPPS